MSQEKKSQKNAGQLILFAEDSLVSHSPSPVRGAEKATADTFGLKCPESFAKLGHDGFWLRTYQGYCQFLTDGSLEKWSETWPRAGIVLSGIAYRRQPLAPLTKGTEFGYWPTPCSAAEAPNLGSNKINGPTSLIQVAKEMWPAPILKVPTPDCSDRRSMKSKQQGLSNFVKMWPTPQAEDASRGPTTPERNAKKLGGVSLQSAAKHWNTPTANDAKNATLPPSQQDRNSLVGDLIQQGVSGTLNPTWVEWLMGLPLGWTDLNCSETAKSFKSLNGLENK